MIRALICSLAFSLCLCSTVSGQGWGNSQYVRQYYSYRNPYTNRVQTMYYYRARRGYNYNYNNYNYWDRRVMIDNYFRNIWVDYNTATFLYR